VDNRKIEVQSRGREAFDLAMKIIFDSAPGGKADAYRIDPDRGLVLYWSKQPEAIALPCPMDWKAAADMAWTWLASRTDDQIHGWADHDGSNVRAWRVYNEDWGHVGSSHYAFVAIQACWGWIGK
jgi:hypothetical protein